MCTSVRNPSLDVETVPKLYQNPSRSPCLYQNSGFICPTIQLEQGLAFHLQLHLRVFLEHLGITLPKQLRHPFLSEACAEWLQIRLQESNVATHYAEMGNLLSLDPKIHGLSTYAKILGGIAYAHGIVEITRSGLYRCIPRCLFVTGVNHSPPPSNSWRCG